MSAVLDELLSSKIPDLNMLNVCIKYIGVISWDRHNEAGVIDAGLHHQLNRCLRVSASNAFDLAGDAQINVERNRQIILAALKSLHLIIFGAPALRMEDV